MTSNGKVLVAHGNTKRLRSAVDLLREAGFEVIATPDGGDAFARFFEEEPGLVLCSAQLPGLSGVSFAHMIASQTPDTHVAILVDPEEPMSLEGATVPTIVEPLTLAALRAAIPALPARPPAAPTDAPPAAQDSSGVFALAALKRFQRDSAMLTVVDENGLHRIAAMAKHQLRQTDEQVIAEGGPGDGFYLVVEGQVRVTLSEKNNQEIARIGAGGFFGEMAMLSDRKRSASVWTVGPTTLLFFARQDFMPLLEDYPTLREVLSGVALKRTEENLWRSLFEDDEVQRSIGSLSEPTLPPPPTMPPPPPVDDAWNQQTPPGGVRVEPGPDLAAILRERDARERALVEAHDVELVAARAGARRSGLAAGVMLGLVLGAGGFFAWSRVAQRDSEPVVAVAQAAAPPAPAPVDVPRAAKPPKEAPKPNPLDAEPPLAGKPEVPVEEEPVEEAPVAKPPEPAEAAVAPAAAPAPVEEAKPAPTITENERKRLRRELIASEVAGAYARAIAAGLALEKGGALDWEASFYLARAQQQGGEATKALARFTDFVTSYPRNDFVDDAYFFSGEILQARGRKEEAIEAFKNVVSRPKSNLIEQAKAHLQALGAPAP